MFKQTKALFSASQTLFKSCHMFVNNKKMFYRHPYNGLLKVTPVSAQNSAYACSKFQLENFQDKGLKGGMIIRFWPLFVSKLKAMMMNKHRQAWSVRASGGHVILTKSSLSLVIVFYLLEVAPP